NAYSAMTSAPGLVLFIKMAQTSLMPSPVAPANAPVILPIMRHVSPWQYSWNTMSESMSPSRDRGGGLVWRTVPVVPGDNALSAVPVDCATNTDGIEIERSVPPIVMIDSRLSVFATITAIAPAFCAFFTLTVKSHNPRSMSAMALVSDVVIASHPSLVGAVPSLTSTIVPVRPLGVSAGTDSREQC